VVYTHAGGDMHRRLRSGPDGSWVAAKTTPAGPGAPAHDKRRALHRRRYQGTPQGSHAVKTRLSRTAVECAFDTWV